MTRTLQQRQQAEKPTESEAQAEPQAEPAPETPPNVERVAEKTGPRTPFAGLPPGVYMHDGSGPPMHEQPPIKEAPEPSAPPKGHVGSYERCGMCGDFLPTGAKACPRCTGIATVPKVMADGKVSK